METTLHVITYLSVLIFIVAVVARFIRIQKYPINLRWEIYPVPHEGKRSEHGGSRLEETDWWLKPRETSKWYEIKFMIPEMILIKALWENNRRLWYRSFPFHFGLYMVATFAGLLALGAILGVTGVAGAAGAASAMKVLGLATTAVGLVGMALAILGGLALLLMRLTDSDLKPYTNFSHIFNLLFIVVTLGLTLGAWAVGGRDFGFLQGYLASLFTLDLAAPVGGPLAVASCVSLSLLTAYIPLTHMSHFFVKWFTWHKIRWDDEPNVKGGRIEVMVQKALEAKVGWAAEHINADGTKNWVDVALEEVKK